MDEEYIRTEDILEEDTVNLDQGEPMDDDDSDDDDMGNRITLRSRLTCSLTIWIIDFS